VSFNYTQPEALSLNVKVMGTDFHVIKELSREEEDERYSSQIKENVDD